ncbi:MAG TPA: phosphoribosylglycinamide formyltransferase, partial [Ktedonobacterales bacterium]|nr:phosphoribosylglycinamide formyltransferase [Ktedonobacterales bacterium]
LAALIAAVERGELRARIALVISSKPDVWALEIAVESGITTQVIAPKQFASRAEEGHAIVAALQAAEVDLVITAGYARIFDPCVIEAYRLRIINIHPSLLPAFPGMAPGPQAEALAYGVKIAGCTTHFITVDTDAGPIIDQTTVPVLDGDTVETLSARILEQEHRLLPASVAAVLAGEIRVMGRRTVRMAPSTTQGDANSARD